MGPQNLYIALVFSGVFLLLLINNHLCFLAWIQVNGDDDDDGDVLVRAVFKTGNGLKYGGTALAKSNCWSMLKGGLTAEASGPADLYFEVCFMRFHRL